jgi:CheY-like chemotaxis protein
MAIDITSILQQAKAAGQASKMTTKGDMPVVLIVDNELKIRIELKNLLVKKSTAMRFIEANDGNEAIDYLTTTQKLPNLMVMDTQMPTMPGHRALKIIRKRYAKERLPIVMLTESNTRELIIELVQGGANEVIIKPYDPQTIAERLLKHILM